ncbi:bublin coiled-coil protein-like [Saccoglossus kowalevskii]|uniref:UPF0184 protein-like n=1 Tax=Saccoglossus kowalevskii TaxID=10224 RepID=A0ABM0GW47_SACKO|nr:PREDICTED: UPF0184 protein-like [Saccoglossus kowalevskii]
MANERHKNHDSGENSGSKESGNAFNLYGENFAPPDLQASETHEFDTLNQTLDQLDSCLSVLEEKNENLNSKLRNLLDSNKKAREELKELETKKY